MKENERKTSKAMIGFEYCNKLFEIERNIKELSPEEKFEKRQELSKPVLDEFLTWLKSLNPAKQSHLGSCRNMFDDHALSRIHIQKNTKTRQSVEIWHRRNHSPCARYMDYNRRICNNRLFHKL